MPVALRRTLLLGVPLLAFGVLLVLLLGGLGNDPRLLPAARLGKPMPAFQLPDLLAPERMVSDADMRGGFALVNVWATWCPSCRQEHEMLMRLAEAGVTIYGVNYKDEAGAARRWLAELGDPYRFSAFDRAGDLGLDLGVYGAPETYLLDARGVIRYRHVGVLDEAVWAREFAPRIESLGQSG